MKDIHFWEFPETKIFLLLKKDFQKQFFDSLIKKLGSRWRLMKKLKVGYTTTKHWQQGWRNRTKEKIEDQYCPIWAVKKICKIYSEVMGIDYIKVLKMVEKNIYAYRAYSGTRVLNPILPIKIIPEVFSIMGHMIADGTWSEGFAAYYINSSNELRKEFANNLNKVFGDVEFYDSISEKRVPHLYFPSAIMYILSSKFNLKFSGVNGLPNYFLNLTVEMKRKVLRAFFDDEGYVHDSNVQICSLDVKFLEIIRKMLKSFNIETSELKPYQDYFRRDGSLSKVFYFDVYSRSIPAFVSKIGFSHPKKKRYLNLMLKIRERGKYPDRKRVVSVIKSELKKNKKLTARDLALKCIITARNLRKNYLYPMEREGVIERIGKKKGKGGATLWSLKK